MPVSTGEYLRLPFGFELVGFGMHCLWENVGQRPGRSIGRAALPCLAGMPQQPASCLPHWLSICCFACTSRGPPPAGVGSANLAKRLIDAVRRRKGLPVEEKVVESATKQRTRARKV